VTKVSDFRFKESDLRTVRYFRAPDDHRIVAIYVRGDFDEYEKFPPYLDTAEDRRHMQEAYRGADPDVERRTKAHLTDDSWPLQVVMLERMPGGTTLPHYHIPDKELPPMKTRHQILICQRGQARVGVFTTGGHHLGDVTLQRDDMILMCEGHEVEFLEPKTRLIEIKQGPFPENDIADKVDLQKVIRASA
jgi:hypothetical protein